MIVYQIGGNRFCHNIGRHHKSNNVIYCADLPLGGYFQKCLDPDCRQVDYRSPLQPLPAAINPEAVAPPPPVDFEALFDGQPSPSALCLFLLWLILTP